MSFNHSLKYRDRNSPPIPANKCLPLTIEIGNDGKEYIAKPDKNNVNRWVLYKKSEPVLKKNIEETRSIEIGHEKIKNIVSQFDISKGVMQYSQLRPRQVQENKERILGKFVNKYFVSQKYDGWQAVWDGKTLMTKTGKNIFPIPSEWRSYLPSFPITGELIIEGKQATAVASLKKGDSEDWKNAKLMVFDIPYSRDPFWKRTQKLKETLGRTGPIRYVEQYMVRSVEMLYKFYKDILEKSGEGVVLTEMDSIYTPMIRSGSRVKLKGRQDSEGKIISYNLKDGKLSSLVIELPDNVRFNLGIGFKNNERINYKLLLPLNKYAKFSYRELSDGKKPKQARFIGLRQDIF